MVRASVIMPVKNGEATIAEAIDSVLAASDERTELLVVNDASSDGTCSIAESYPRGRVRLLQNPGRGQSDALNFGVQEARGDIVMRCDADDRYAAGRLDWQLAWLDEHSEIGAVCGDVSAIRSDGRALADIVSGLDDGHDVSSDLRNGRVRSHLGAYAMRRSCVLQAGGFRSFFRYSQDFDFLFRLGETCEVRYRPLPAYVIRFSDGSVCRRTPLNVRQWYLQTAVNFREERARAGQDALQRGEPPCPPEEDPNGAKQSAREAVQAILLHAAWQNLDAGRVGQGMRQGIEALVEEPGRAGAWRDCAKILAVGLKRFVAGRAD